LNNSDCCLNDDDEFNDDNYISNNSDCYLNNDDEFNDDNYLSNNLNCCFNDDDEFNNDNYLSNNLCYCLNDDDKFNDDNYLSNNSDWCLNDDDEFNDQWSISEIFDEKTTMSSLLLNKLTWQIYKTNVQKEKLFMKRSNSYKYLCDDNLNVNVCKINSKIRYI
jgi:hypothetical protein